MYFWLSCHKLDQRWSNKHIGERANWSKQCRINHKELYKKQIKNLGFPDSDEKGEAHIAEIYQTLKGIDLPSN